MSSTNRGAQRDLDDYYATPPQLARRICEQIEADYHPRPRRILEPGCGAGSFLAACRATWPRAHIEGAELNPDLARKAREKGFAVPYADVLTTLFPRFDLIIGNPPFLYAERFVHTLLPRLTPERGILAFLLRLNFLGGKARYESLWRAHAPAHIYAMPARPGFTPDGGSDSIEYMVALFRCSPPPPRKRRPSPSSTTSGSRTAGRRAPTRTRAAHARHARGPRHAGHGRALALRPPALRETAGRPALLGGAA